MEQSLQYYVLRSSVSIIQPQTHLELDQVLVTRPLYFVNDTLRTLFDALGRSHEFLNLVQVLLSVRFDAATHVHSGHLALQTSQCVNDLKYIIRGSALQQA